MTEAVVFAQIWLSVSSVAVTTGRMIARPLIAYPVGAVLSFLLFGLLLTVAMPVPALGILFDAANLPFGSEGEG